MPSVGVTSSVSTDLICLCVVAAHHQRAAHKGSADAEDKSAASSDLDTRSGMQANEEARNPVNSPNAGYVYKVHIRTGRSQFVVDGSARQVQSGMTVQADIVTDRRRVMDFFLSPVIKYMDEGLKVR